MSFSTRVIQIAPVALCALTGVGSSLVRPLAHAQLAPDRDVRSEAGKRTGPREPADGHGPPPFAYAACSDKVAGDECSVSLGDRSIEGSCVTGLNDKLFCLPDELPPPPPADGNGPPPGGPRQLEPTL